MRQNGRALYASRADPNGPTRVEEDPDVRAGQARARRERGAMDRALAAARAAAHACTEAVDAAEGSAVEATSNASEAVAADREAA